jgi:hypothetical protein
LVVEPVSPKPGPVPFPTQILEPEPAAPGIPAAPAFQPLFIPPQPARVFISPQVAKAQQKVAVDTSRLVAAHETSIRRRVDVEAKKLAKAGVPVQTIRKEVRAVLKTLPSTQIKKALDERRRTGSISAATKTAVAKAQAAYQKAHPELQRAVQQAAKPLKKAIDTAHRAQASEADVRRRLDAEAQKLATAGVPIQKIQREVQAVLKTLPSAQGVLKAPIAAGKKAVQQHAQDVLKAPIAAGKKAVQQQAQDVLKAPIAAGTKALQKASAPITQSAKALQKAAAPLRAEIDAFARDVPGPLKDAAADVYKALREGRMPDAKSLQKLGEKKGKELLEKYGKQYGSEALQKIIPNIKIPGGTGAAAAGAAAKALFDYVSSGKKITVEGAAGAVHEAATEFTESYIQQQTGLSIRLPRKPSPEEIGKMFGSLIPKDAGQAIEMTISIGVQAAASALTTVLAGTAIGSVIPGLGTVVGLAAAIGVTAIKSALKEKPPPYARACKGIKSCPSIPKKLVSNIKALKAWQQQNCKNPYVMPPANADGTSKLSSIELIPWIATTTAPVYKALAEERAKVYCGKGEIVTYLYALGTMRSKAFELSKTTPGVLGLPELNRLIALYERAPRSYAWFDDVKALGGVRTGTNKIIQLPNRELGLMLDGMKARRTYLQKLLKDTTAGLSKLSKDSSSVSLVDNLLRPIEDEIRQAFLQFYLTNQSKTAETWLTVLLTLRKIGSDKRDAILKTSMSKTAYKYDPNKPVIIT